MAIAKFLHNSIVLFETPQQGIIESAVMPHCRGRVRALDSIGENVWVMGQQVIILLERSL